MINLKKSKILVTGADGFIGSHLTEALVLLGANVRAFVMYNPLHSWGWLDHCMPEVKGEFEAFSGDIRDPHGVSKAVEGCDVIFHLAALISIPFSYQSPYAYVDTNVKGTLNLVNAARFHNVKRIVHTSTSEVYGTAQYVPIDELHPLQAQSPYSASKIAADQIAASYYCSFETPIVTARPFNTYGPRQSARAIIPTVITQLLNKKTEIYLGSLNPTRDFSYVTDTVEGMIALAECEEALGKTFNLGSGYEISIGNLAREIAQILGIDKEIKIKTDQQRLRPKKSEVERLMSSTGKVTKYTQWEPKFSGYDGLKNGLEKTIAWFSQINNLKHYKPELYNI